MQGTRVEVKGIQEKPLHVDVPVQVCDDPDPFVYPKGLICAGAPNHDSCQGDSGGPLMNRRAENGGFTYEWVGKLFVYMGQVCSKHHNAPVGKLTFHV